MPQAAIERLANGLTVSVVETPASHQVLVSLFLRVGSRYERAATNGISHLLEHMLFRGNRTHRDSRAIFEAFEEVGGVPNAMTEVEYTEFFFVAHPARVARGLELLALLVREPLFPTLEKERGVVLDEIFYDYDEGGNLIHPGALAARLLWPDHPLGLSVTGTLASLPGLDGAKLRRHHRAHYGAANAVLGLAGKISAPKALQMVQLFFGDWAAGPQPRAPKPAPQAPRRAKEPRVQLVKHTDNQFQLQLSFPAPGYNAPQDPALGLLGRLLDDGPTSLLQMEVREERGLVYHIGAGYSGFQDAGQVDVTTSVQPERLGEVLRTVLRCLADFRDQGPNPQELARALRRYRFDLDFERDSLAAGVARWAWALLYSVPRSEEEEWRRVEAITAAEIRELAQQIFQPEAVHLVVVGPLNRAAEKAIAGALRDF